jgi:ParB/RepB/Spo0J family partition protein
MAAPINLMLDTSDIIVSDGRRPVNDAAVRKLADSIERLGQQHPITVRKKHGSKVTDREYVLVAGLHRVKACERLGLGVRATLVTMTNDEARMWEISENLHRSDLSKLQRDEQIAEWIELSDKARQSLQLATKGHRGESGVNAAARELGIEQTEAHRAVKVASLSDEAKEAAIEEGLDDNRSALLAAAKEKTPTAQVAVLRRIADPPLNDDESAEKQVAALMSAWNKAGAEARTEFLSRIDKPVMDRRYA